MMETLLWAVPSALLAAIIARWISATFGAPPPNKNKNAIRNGDPNVKKVAIFTFGPWEPVEGRNITVANSLSSPPCTKAVTFVKMAGLDYEETAADVTKAPKGKLPYMRHGDNIVADSHFIIQYLVNTFGEGKTHLGQLRIKLTPQEKARAVLLEHICADDLYCAVIYSGWVMEEGWKKMVNLYFAKLPSFLMPIIPDLWRRKFANWMHGHGFSRHSYGDIASMIDEQLEAISILLGDQTYFNGSEPTIADPPVFAVLDVIMGTDVDPLGLQDIVRKYANLERFRKHVRRTVYNLKE